MGFLAEETQALGQSQRLECWKRRLARHVHHRGQRLELRRRLELHWHRLRRLELHWHWHGLANRLVVCVRACCAAVYKLRNDMAVYTAECRAYAYLHACVLARVYIAQIGGRTAHACMGGA